MVGVEPVALPRVVAEQDVGTQPPDPAGDLGLGLPVGDQLAVDPAEEHHLAGGAEGPAAALLLVLAGGDQRVEVGVGVPGALRAVGADQRATPRSPPRPSGPGWRRHRTRCRRGGRRWPAPGTGTGRSRDGVRSQAARRRRCRRGEGVGQVVGQRWSAGGRGRRVGRRPTRGGGRGRPGRARAARPRRRGGRTTRPVGEAEAARRRARRPRWCRRRGGRGRADHAVAPGEQVGQVARRAAGRLWATTTRLDPARRPAWRRRPRPRRRARARASTSTGRRPTRPSSRPPRRRTRPSPAGVLAAARPGSPSPGQPGTPVGVSAGASRTLAAANAFTGMSAAAATRGGYRAPGPHARHPTSIASWVSGVAVDGGCSRSGGSRCGSTRSAERRRPSVG